MSFYDLREGSSLLSTNHDFRRFNNGPRLRVMAELACSHEGQVLPCPVFTIIGGGRVVGPLAHIGADAMRSIAFRLMQTAGMF